MKRVRFAEDMPTDPNTQRTAVLDTGATGHFFPYSYKGLEERATKQGID